MGAASRNGLRHSVTVEQRKAFIEAAAQQRDVEFVGGAMKFTGGTPERLDDKSSPIDREFYDFTAPLGVTARTRRRIRRSAATSNS